MKPKLNNRITKDKAFDKVNDLFGLTGENKITEKDFTPKINRIYQEDLKLGQQLLVQGTPTIFVNGQKDTDRTLYKKIVK